MPCLHRLSEDSSPDRTSWSDLISWSPLRLLHYFSFIPADLIVHTTSCVYPTEKMLVEFQIIPHAEAKDLAIYYTPIEWHNHLWLYDIIVLPRDFLCILRYVIFSSKLSQFFCFFCDINFSDLTLVSYLSPESCKETLRTVLQVELLVDEDDLRAVTH